MSKQVRLFAAVGTVFVLSVFVIGRSWADTTILSNLGLLEQLTKGAVSDVASQLELDDDAPVVLVTLAPHEGNTFVKDRLALALADLGYDVVVSRSPADAPAEAKPGPAKAGGKGTANGSGNDAANGAGNGAGAGDEVESEDEAMAEEMPAPRLDPVELAERALSHAGGNGTQAPGTVLDVQILEFGVRYSEVGRRMMLGPVQFTRVGGVYLRVSKYDGETGYVQGMATAERHHWDRVSGRERFLAEGASYPFDRPELKAPGLGTYLEPALVVGIVGGLIFLFYENQK